MSLFRKKINTKCSGNNNPQCSNYKNGQELGPHRTVCPVCSSDVEEINELNKGLLIIIMVIGFLFIGTTAWAYFSSSPSFNEVLNDGANQSDDSLNLETGKEETLEPPFPDDEEDEVFEAEDEKPLETPTTDELISQNLRSWHYHPQAGFQVENFENQSEGFSLLLSQVGEATPQYIGLQVISNHALEFSSERTHNVRFEVRSNQDIELRVRIGQQERPYTSSVQTRDYIAASEEFKAREISFSPVTDVPNQFFYFQLGETEANTEVEIRNIVIEEQPD